MLLWFIPSAIWMLRSNLECDAPYFCNVEVIGRITLFYFVWIFLQTRDMKKSPPPTEEETYNPLQVTQRATIIWAKGTKPDDTFLDDDVLRGLPDLCDGSSVSGESTVSSLSVGTASRFSTKRVFYHRRFHRPNTSSLEREWGSLRHRSFYGAESRRWERSESSR